MNSDDFFAFVVSFTLKKTTPEEKLMEIANETQWFEQSFYKLSPHPIITLNSAFFIYYLANTEFKAQENVVEPSCYRESSRFVFAEPEDLDIDLWQNNDDAFQDDWNDAFYNDDKDKTTLKILETKSPSYQKSLVTRMEVPTVAHLIANIELNLHSFAKYALVNKYYHESEIIIAMMGIYFNIDKNKILDIWFSAANKRPSYILRCLCTVLFVCLLYFHLI